MNARAMAIIVLVLPAAAWAQGQSQARPITLPHAGLAMELPADLQITAPTDVFEALTAQRASADGTPLVALTLAVAPVNADVTLKQFAGTLLGERGLAVKDFKAQEASSIQAAGLAAIRAKVSYEFRGQPTVAERVFFLRPIEGKSFQLGYVLTIEARPEQASELPAMRDAVIASMKTVELVPSAEAPLDLPAEPTKLSEAGISLKLPVGWSLEQGSDRLKAVRTDYVSGGLPYPVLTVKARQARPGETAQACAEEILAEGKRLPAEMKFNIVEEGAVQTGSGDGYQAIGTLTIEGQPVTMASWCQVKDGRAYRLAVTVLGDRNARAKAMLEQLVQTVQLFPPMQSQPATAPKE